MLIGVEIDEVERDRVARREVTKAVRVGREARTDDLRALETPAQEQRTAGKKRLAERFAELGDFVHRAAQFAGVSSSTYHPAPLAP